LARRGGLLLAPIIPRPVTMYKACRALTRMQPGASDDLKSIAMY
jgi:hypothetical protein